MIDQNLLESLPSDPEEAFAIFEAKVRGEVPDHQEWDNSYEQRQYDAERLRKVKEYILAVSAYLDLYEIDIGVNFEELLSERGNDFFRAFEEASSKVIFFSNKCAIKHSQKLKRGTTCIYVIEPASKIRIHKAIDKIREIITEADLSDLKKESLFGKLNAFAFEVDRDRTRLESFAAMYVSVKGEAKEIAGLSENIDKIWQAIARGGKELWKALPKITVKHHLEAPQKKIENQSQFDLDDEIPF